MSRPSGAVPQPSERIHRTPSHPVRSADSTDNASSSGSDNDAEHDSAPSTIRAIQHEFRGQNHFLEVNLHNQLRILQSHSQRFDAVDKRFDAVDKRFDAVDMRFDAMDKRFEEQQQNTDKRFDEQRQNTDQRLEEQRQHTDQRFEEQRQYIDDRFSESKAQQYNRGQTHIHSYIRPVSSPVPKYFPARVHQFLRLKNRKNWHKLASLLLFFKCDSWSTWGLLPAFSDDSDSDGDGDDEDVLLGPKHNTLNDAIELAPEIALQELGSYIGLDLDRIFINRQDDERLQEERAAREKRKSTNDLGSENVKREKRDGATQPFSRPLPSRTTTSPQQVMRSPSDWELGWDTRRTEDRTPSDKKYRIRDAAR